MPPCRIACAAALLAACSASPPSTPPVVDTDDAVTAPPADTVPAETGADANSAPTAVVRPEQQLVAPGTVARLDARGSIDGQDDPLTFGWTLAEPEAPATLVGDGAGASFETSTPGTYEVHVRVSDGALDDDATALVHVSDDTRPPTARATGPTPPTLAGADVVLDGARSGDPDGDTLTYAWTLASRPDASAAVIDPSDPVRPLLHVDVDGTYVVLLRVSDGVLTSWPAWVVFAVGDGGDGGDAHPDVR